MNALWLSEEQAKQIVTHTRAAAPQEACGLIFGRGIRAEVIVPVANVAADPQRHYMMNPAEMAEYLPAHDRAGLTLIGLYHSHPAGEPIPSQTDIREATFPHTAYLIAGLRRNQPKLAAWTITNGRVQRISLHIGHTAPPSTEPPLSRAQQAAILVSAVLAFVAMLALSLYLLPPAPALPLP